MIKVGEVGKWGRWGRGWGKGDRIGEERRKEKGRGEKKKE